MSFMVHNNQNTDSDKLTTKQLIVQPNNFFFQVFTPCFGDEVLKWFGVKVSKLINHNRVYCIFTFATRISDNQPIPGELNCVHTDFDHSNLHCLFYS